ncbi:hypothetical protein BN135_3635 [Cronobacter muytjensii 530]
MAGALRRLRLAGVENMEVEAVAVSKHHNMGCPPDMRH